MGMVLNPTVVFDPKIYSVRCIDSPNCANHPVPALAQKGCLWIVVDGKETELMSETGTTVHFPAVVSPLMAITDQPGQTDGRQ